MSDTPSSRRDAIDAAFDEVEGVEPAETVDSQAAPETGNTGAPIEGAPVSTSPSPPEPQAEPETTATDKVRDEHGRFTKAPKTAATTGTAPPQAQKPSQSAAKPTTATQTATKAPDVGRELKPPVGWTPEAREHWATLPQEVKRDIWNRERAADIAIQGSSEAKRFHESFQRTVGPYEKYIRAEGVEPLQAVQNLMQAMAVLHDGTPMHKAQIASTILRTYGVDPDLLTQVYNGTAQPNAGQPTASMDPGLIAQQVEQRVLQQVEQRRQAAVLQHAAGEVEQFGQDKEFFEDVRPLMSVVLDAATAAKKHMTLDEAYKMALQFHPGTQSVLQQREARGTAKSAQASTERARLAASSIRSTPAIAPPPTGGFTNRRDAIDAAWDEVASR